MADRHPPGYHADYQRRLREANRRLREAHEDEWRRYFDEAGRETAPTASSTGSPDPMKMISGRPVWDREAVEAWMKTL